MAASDGGCWGIEATLGALCSGVGTFLRISCSIRGTPDDFLVTEIDTNGVVLPRSAAEATEREYRHPPPLSAVRQLDKAPLRIALVTRLEELSASYGVPAHTVEALRALDAAESAAAAAGPVVVGTFPDKETRGCVRCSIKSLLPSVRLDFSPTDAHTLVALPDPDFAAQAAIIGRERAAAIARYCIDTNSGVVDNDDEPLREPLRLSLSDLTAQYGEYKAKELRRRLHGCITKQYPYLDTKFDNGVLFVSRTPRGANGRKRGGDGRVIASVFTHFVMHKRCVDAMEAKRRVAKELRVQLESVATAGTKDKRAVTWQRVSVVGDHTRRLSSSTGELTALRTADGEAFVRLFAAELQAAPVRMGELGGNRFTLRLRNLRCNFTPTSRIRDLVHERVANVRRSGFLNYFGPQRFGELGGVADMPGIHVLRGSHAAALACVLAPLQGESCEAAAAKELWRTTGDPYAAAKLIPRACRDLTEVMTQLQRRLRAPYGPVANITEETSKAVLMGLPFELRQMWMHAAQSFIFNAVVSAVAQDKARRLGTADLMSKPELGDWVMVVGGDGVKGSAAARAQRVEVDTVLQLDETDRLSIVAPLLGEGTTIDPSRDEGLDAAVVSVLCNLGVPRVNFNHSPLGVKLKGDWRPMLQYPLHLEVKDPPLEENTDAADVIDIELGLPTSSYATVLLREILGAFPAVGSASTAVNQDEEDDG